MPRCDTGCPFWTRYDATSDGNALGFCHFGGEDEYEALDTWWCRHHPYAPRTTKYRRVLKRREDIPEAEEWMEWEETESIEDWQKRLEQKEASNG